MYVQHQAQKLIFKQLLDGEGFTEPVEFTDCNGLRVATYCHVTRSVCPGVTMYPGSILVPRKYPGTPEVSLLELLSTLRTTVVAGGPPYTYRPYIHCYYRVECYRKYREVLAFAKPGSENGVKTGECKIFYPKTGECNRV